MEAIQCMVIFVALVCVQPGVSQEEREQEREGEGQEDDGRTHWGYGWKAYHWSDTSSLCGSGKRQSPIDVGYDGELVEKDLGEIQFTNYDVPYSGDLNIENDGHDIKVDVHDVFNVTISGGGLPGTFKLYQWHYHWGPTESTGSEHSVRGHHFTMEIHLVHVNLKYGGDISRAVNYEDGIAVVAVLLEEQVCGDVPETTFERIANLAPDLTAFKASTLSVTDFHIAAMLPRDRSRFYRYRGSLTTPTCQEVVTWTVLSDPINVCLENVNSLRHMKDEDGVHMFVNIRPLQKLYGRNVILSGHSASGGTTVVDGSLRSVVVSNILLLFAWLGRQ